MLHVSNMLNKPALGYVLEQEIFFFSKESRPALGHIQSSLLFNEYQELFPLGLNSQTAELTAHFHLV